ncbi:MAG TPA: 4Fe-4S dicluster-binding protein [Candidatus Eisenbacteria bacterium]|nr:4Fe-4S dicluster-binding protein [Candidatus Eisenbacteria bacterium]
MSEVSHNHTRFESEDSARKAKETADAVTQKPPRKKAPPKLAVINQNGCTGCEVCIVFCPVDCIEIVPGVSQPNLQQVVEVDLDRCIGCSLCAKNCPWDTIDMLNHDEAYKQAPAVTLRTVCAQKTVSDPPEAPAA